LKDTISGVARSAWRALYLVVVIIRTQTRYKRGCVGESAISLNALCKSFFMQCKNGNGLREGIDGVLDIVNIIIIIYRI
jgi:hypothetical protein